MLNKPDNLTIASRLQFACFDWIDVDGFGLQYRYSFNSGRTYFHEGGELSQYTAMPTGNVTISFTVIGAVSRLSATTVEHIFIPAPSMADVATQLDNALFNLDASSTDANVQLLSALASALILPDTDRTDTDNDQRNTADSETPDVLLVAVVEEIKEQKEKLMNLMTNVLSTAAANLSATQANSFMDTVSQVSQPTANGVVLMNDETRTQAIAMISTLADKVDVTQTDSVTQAIANVMIFQDPSSSTPDPATNARVKEAVTKALGALNTFNVRVLENLAPDSPPVVTNTATLSAAVGHLGLASRGRRSADQSAGALVSVGSHRFTVPLQWFNETSSLGFNTVSHKKSPYSFSDRQLTDAVASFSLLQGGAPFAVHDENTCINIVRHNGNAGIESAATFSTREGEPALLQFTVEQQQTPKTLHIVVEPFRIGGLHVPGNEAQIEVSVASSFKVSANLSSDEFDYVFTPLSLRSAEEATNSHTEIRHRSHVLQIIPRQHEGFTCQDPDSMISKTVTDVLSTNYTIRVKLLGAGAPTTNFSTRVFHTECLYLGTRNMWLHDNCSVAPFSTPSLWQCRCNHLTTFGGGNSKGGAFVKPNLVQVRAVTTDDIASNSVVFVVFLCVWLLFAVVLWHARNEDVRARLAEGPIAVEGNSGLHSGRYQITVKTGIRMNAGLGPETRVFIQLSGTKGRTPELELSHDWRPLFTRGATDTFIATSATDIGVITAVTLRHDGNGDRPPCWFISHVLVVNLNSGISSLRYFWIDRWLAFNLGDGLIEITSEGQTAGESATLARSFQIRLTRSLADQHTIVSVFLSPPSATQFGKAQRTMCCMVFFSGALFANAFFYQTNGEDLNMAQTLTTGFISSVLVMIPVTAIIWVFRHVVPRKKEVRVGIAQGIHMMAQGIHSRRRTSYDDGSIGRRSLFRRSLPHIVLEGRGEKSKLPLPALVQQVANTVSRSAKTIEETNLHTWASPFEGLEGAPSRPSTSNENVQDQLQKDSSIELPYWCAWLAWGISLALCIWASYYVLLLSFSWGSQISWSWLVSVLSSVFLLTAITDPLIVVTVALLGAVWFGGVGKVKIEATAHSKTSAAPSTIESLRLKRLESIKASAVRVSDKYLDERRKRAKLDEQMGGVIANLLRFIFFYTACSIVFVGTQDTSNVILAVGHVVSTVGVSGGEAGIILGTSGSEDTTFAEITSTADWLDWLEESISATIQIGKHELTMVGAPRIRQLRVSNHSCTIPTSFQDKFHTCYADWSATTNSDIPYHAHLATSSSRLPSWRYQGSQTRTTLRTTFIGTGYVQLLPSSNATQAVEVVHELRERRWLDDATRMAALEVTFYSPSIDCIITGLFAAEFPASGGSIPFVDIRTHKLNRYLSEDYWLLILCEVALVLVCTYQAYLLTNVVRTRGWAILFQLRHLFEFLLVLSIFVGIGLHVARWLEADRIADEYKSHGTTTSYFGLWHKFGALDLAVKLTDAIVIALATIKWVFLWRHNTKVQRLLHLFTLAFSHAIGIVFQLVIVFGGYCFAGHVAFGASLRAFSTLEDSAATLFSAKLGEFDFYSWLRVHEDLVPIYFISFMAVSVFILLNMFVCILNDCYVASITKHRVSELDLYLFLKAKARLFLGWGDDRDMPAIQRKQSAEVYKSLKDLDFKFAVFARQVHLMSREMKRKRSRRQRKKAKGCRSDRRIVLSDGPDAHTRLRCHRSTIESVLAVFEQYDDNQPSARDPSLKEIDDAIDNILGPLEDLLAEPNKGATAQQRIDHVRIGVQINKAIKAKRTVFSRVMHDIETAFSCFDRNSTGEISAVELEGALKRLGLGLSAEQSAEVFASIDVDGSGGISSAEFKAFILTSESLHTLQMTKF